MKNFQKENWVQNHVNFNFMKYILLFIIISTFSNTSNARYFRGDLKLTTKDTIIINEIIYSISGNEGWDKRELLEKNLFTIIFKENGNVQLKYNGKCPTSSNKDVICSYFGKIEIKEFEMITSKLKKINFTSLKDEYIENIDDRGSENYLITYNKDKQKRIRDENFEIPELQEFNEMLINLKKQIKWTPVL